MHHMHTQIWNGHTYTVVLQGCIPRHTHTHTLHMTNKILHLYTTTFMDNTTQHGANTFPSPWLSLPVRCRRGSESQWKHLFLEFWEVIPLKNCFASLELAWASITWIHLSGQIGVCFSLLVMACTSRLIYSDTYFMVWRPGSLSGELART